MLMLAMQAGFPTQAYEVFLHLGTKPDGPWWEFVDGLNPRREGSSYQIDALELSGLTAPEAETWRKFHDALQAQRPEVQKMQDNLRPFVENYSEVARFGFVTGRAIAPERDGLRASRRSDPPDAATPKLGEVEPIVVTPGQRVQTSIIRDRAHARTGERHDAERPFAVQERDLGAIRRERR